MNPVVLRKPVLSAVPFLFPLLLAACASLPSDGGRGAVETLVAERGQSVPPPQPPSGDIAALVAEKIAHPLTPEDAVAIAYLQNPRLRAAYARLGLAAADVYDAGRLSNPRLSVEALFGKGPSPDELTLGLTQSFGDLLFLSARRKVADRDFARAKAMAGQEILDVAAEVQAACLRLMAAQQVALMRGKIADAAAAAATLADRFYKAGNINALSLAMEQAAASDARLAHLAAEAELRDARDALNRLMGFRAAPGWTLAGELQAPQGADADADAIIALALGQRLDLIARRDAITARAAALGLSQRQRWADGAEAGVAHKRESDGGRQTGPSLSVELPLFNSGKGRIARATAELDQAMADLDEAEIAVANQIRSGLARLATARARAEEYRTVLLPARAAIVARMQEEVNFMLRGPFDLIRARQQDYEASEGYIAAVRDYWIARADLARDAGGRLPEFAARGETVPPPAPPAAEPPAMDHSHHHHQESQQ